MSELGQGFEIHLRGFNLPVKKTHFNFVRGEQMKILNWPSRQYDSTELWPKSRENRFSKCER